MMPLGNRFSFFANVVLNVSASFLGCSHNREQSPVKWGDFLSIHPSVHLPVHTSIHMSPPARPPGLQASQDFQLASQASEPASKAFQLASQASEHQDSSFWAVAPIGDKVLKNGEIFHSFVHLFVCLFVRSSVPSRVQDPARQASDPAMQASDPAMQASDPASQASDPAMQPSDPANPR